MTARVEAFGVAGIGEVAAGDDVAVLITDALRTSGERLVDGDVVVVSSKVVSKAAGLTVQADSRESAVRQQTVRTVAERLTPRGITSIVQSRSGPVLAAAGVDASNVAPGTVLVLPPDPDRSARELRARLAELAGVTRLGVVVSDTAGRPWRDGQVDIAIGAAGVVVTDDLRGAVDPHGNPLEVTVRALADELAALADLVKGKLDGVPAAVVRGLPELVREVGVPEPTIGARELLRDPGHDWFRYGHAEAVHAALGIQPGQPPLPPVAAPRAPVEDRLARTLEAAVQAGAVAMVTRERVTVPLHYRRRGPTALVQLMTAVGDVEAGADLDELLAGAAALGAFAQAAKAIGWADDLVVATAVAPLDVFGHLPTLILVATDADDDAPELDDIGALWEDEFG